MRLNLVSVRLRNFRIHEDYTFTPASNGVTAIVGRNGHGKSTIIDGIAWALYGTRPNTGIKNSSWRRIGAGKDEESFVDLKLKLGKSEMRVKRSIVNAKTGAVQCECWLDGVQEAGPAVSHAERWIVKTLGMDENGFLSTILVQQKHVGQLVAASAAERRKTLEKLTGITAVTNALDAAKDEEKTYSKALAAYGVDDDRLDSLDKEAKRNRKTHDEIITKVDKLKERLSRIDTEGKALRKKTDAMQQAVSDSERYRERQAVLEHESDMYADQIVSLSKRRDELKKNLPGGGTGFDTSEMKRIQSELDDAEASMASARAVVAGLEKTIKDRPSDDDMKSVKESIASLESEISRMNPDGLTDELDMVLASMAETKAYISQSKKSLDELSSVNGGKCPTCLQPIDDPEHIRKELEQSIEASRSRLDESNLKADDIRSRINDVNTLRGKLQDAESQLSDYNGMCGAADEAQSKLAYAMGEVEALDASVKSLRSAVSKFESYKSQYEQYDYVRNNLVSVMEKSESNATELEKVKKALKDIGSPDKELLASLLQQLDEKREKRSSLSEDIIRQQGEAELAESKADAAEREASVIREQMDKRKAILSKLEVATGSVSVLSTFREHMVLSAIPKVTDYASDLLSKISEGKFISVSIDKRFGINVETGDGIKETVSQLSGGEEDLVAICLRLAISVMLSDGNPSMLVLDEVLTAMDSDRAAAILEAMQDMSAGQIIIVAHNEIIKSIADEVIEL